MSLLADVLRAVRTAPGPVPTPALVAPAAGRPHARQQVWAVLRELERAGLVRKAGRGGPGRNGRRPTLWAVPNSSGGVPCDR